MSDCFLFASSKKFMIRYITRKWHAALLRTADPKDQRISNREQDLKVREREKCGLDERFRDSSVHK
jgi:hypothetical protein